MKTKIKIQEPIKTKLNKINYQNTFNQKIKPRNGRFRENDYRMKNYYNRNDNSNNISYEVSKNKITKIMLIKDPNQIQNFGFSERNPNNQIINKEPNNKPNNNVSNIYQNDKKNKYEIKIENKKIIDEIAQNQINVNNYNKKILSRPKSIIKNNNDHNIINNENNQKRFIRSKTNNRNNISKKQPYTKICFNIFDKLLKMISNISDIKDYFSNSKKEVIKKCIDAYKNGLTYILYLINNNRLSSENELNKFVENFIKQNSLDENGELSDIQYVEPIINYIYKKINNELTKVKQTENNAISRKFYDENPSFEFMKNHNSIISDLFLGIFNKEVMCQSHKKEICKKEIFYVIDFDLKEIHDFTCFNYYFCKDNKTEKKSYCDSCFFETIKIEKKYIYSPPIIITLVLSNTENYKLDLQKEINISKFIADKSKNLFTGIYDLISTLYMTRKERKFIIHSESIENNNQPSDNYSNAIPIMLLYQMREHPDNIKLTLRFQNGFPPKDITLNKRNNIKEVKQQISNKFNLDIKKFVILINGNRTEENEILSKYLKDINDVGIIFIDRN